MFAVTLKTPGRSTTTRYFSVWEAADELAERHGSKVETVNAQALKDVELEQALFCAEHPRTDDALLLECRREKVKRLTVDEDVDGMQELVARIVFDSLGSLYENANLHSTPWSVSAYDVNGRGVEITIPKPFMGSIAD